MKNKGFSLIEITIAIALMGIMAGAGIPQLRKQLAIGKDTKAIVTLGTLRTASELYYIEHGKSIYQTDETLEVSLSKLEPYLDNKTFLEIRNGHLEIGGYRGKTSTEDKPETSINYGGDILLTFTNPTTNQIGDGIQLWFTAEAGKEYDTKGNKWIEY